MYFNKIFSKELVERSAKYIVNVVKYDMERENLYAYFNSSTIDFNYMLVNFASDGFDADD